MLDVVKVIRSSLGTCRVLAAIDALTFQHAKESRGQSIVSAATHSAHTADQAVAVQESLILVTGKLAAPIRVLVLRRSSDVSYANPVLDLLRLVFRTTNYPASSW